MLVRDIMTKNVITITSDTYVLDAERIMEQKKIGRLPVVDDGRLVGIVTKNDVLKASPTSTTRTHQKINVIFFGSGKSEPLVNLRCND